MSFTSKISATAKGAGSPLQSATAENSGLAEIAEVLIQYGAEVDARGSNNITALHRAANKGHLPVIRVLLENGANPFLTHEYGRDAAHTPPPQLRRPAIPLVTPDAATAAKQPKGLFSAFSTVIIDVLS